MKLKTDLDRLRSEIETAVRVFYAYEAFNKLLIEQRHVDLINTNVYFWKIFLSSIQTKLFIALGRLYDDSNDAFSFHRFINNCRVNINEFGRDYLEKRKMDGVSDRPEWLDDYLNDAYFAEIKDIEALAKLARPFTKRMKGLYKEIRSKVFAHAIHTDAEVISNLFEDTDLEEIESALLALWSIYSQVWQLYNNGRKPTLELEAYPYKAEVIDCVKMAIIGKV